MVIEKAWAKLHLSYNAIDGINYLIQVVCLMKSCMHFLELQLKIIWSEITWITLMLCSKSSWKLNKKNTLFAVELHLKIAKSRWNKLDWSEVMLIQWYIIIYP